MVVPTGTVDVPMGEFFGISRSHRHNFDGEPEGLASHLVVVVYRHLVPFDCRNCKWHLAFFGLGHTHITDLDPSSWELVQ